MLFFRTVSFVKLVKTGLLRNACNPGSVPSCVRPKPSNDTAPAVGFTRTITAANVADASVMNDWAMLQSQAAASNIDLIAKGTIDGLPRGLVYDPVSNGYVSDKTDVGPFTQADLQAKIAGGDIISFSGVPLGSGVRMGIDRDLDGRLDDDPVVVTTLP